jgi:hypothetical protein
MAVVLALPARGDVLLDARGSGRALRVSWHHEGGVVVLSLWHGGVCTGSFRLGNSDVPALVDALVSGLVEGYSSPTPGALPGSAQAAR